MYRKKMEKTYLDQLISQRICLLLLKNDMSQTNFGVLIGKAQPRISDWITCKRSISMIDYINIFEKTKNIFLLHKDEWYQFRDNRYYERMPKRWEK